MSDVVISVENLSKSYLIGHDGPQERYHSLRDTIVRHGKNYVRKAVDMARGRQIIQGDSVEEFWALKDVSFEVKRGEVLGIIGRNGAGKSTLLKILSRITEPTSGRVVLDGRVASLLEVGTGFHPELTGRENIFLNGAILGMSKVEIRQKFDEIVEFAGVEKFLDTPVKRYSSGMYVRLAFAVAAHLEPEILIIDEVLAVGDAEFQKKCLGKMQEVAKGGRTVLFVSHNLGQVRALCTKAALLDSGTIKFLGTPEAALSRYQEIQTTGEVSQKLEGPLADQVVLLSVKIENTTTGPAVCLIGDNAVLAIRIHLRRAIPKLRITFALFANNIRLCTLHESDSSAFSHADEGNHLVRCQLPTNFLVPGHFSLGLGLCDEHPACYAWNPDIFEFELLEDQSNRGAREDVGLVTLPWEIQRNSKLMENS